MSVFCEFVCCQVEVAASGRSPVQGNPTDWVWIFYYVWSGNLRNNVALASFGLLRQGGRWRWRRRRRERLTWLTPTTVKYLSLSEMQDQVFMRNKYKDWSRHVPISSLRILDASKENLDEQKRILSYFMLVNTEYLEMGPVAFLPQLAH